MDRFLRRVAATIARHHMLAPGDTVLVAYSAGADSTALLHALVQLKDKLGCTICACHIHHGLRGAEADADAEHAAQFAASLGVPFSLARTDVRAYAAENRLSLEAAAREIRYHLLEQAAESCRAARIATGHTADDQAETVILNLLRGAGPAGIAGMPPVRGNIIRPLMSITRADVEQYCSRNSLAHRLDQSNRDLRFTRNRIRHEVLPALARIQPNVVASLCRLADIMRAEDDYFSLRARADADRLDVREDALDGVPIPIREFAALHPALQRRLARIAIARAKGDERDIEMERVDALVRLVTAGRTGAAIHLPGDLTARRTYRDVLIQRPQEIESPPAGEWPLPVPGEIGVRQLGFAFATTPSASTRRPQTPLTALLDAAAVTAPLSIRTWRPGDRFIPLGMTQSVKLQDFFVNAKVPRALRAWVPLVLCGDTIAWIVGHRISDRFKVTARTRRTIRIEATEHFIFPSEA